MDVLQIVLMYFIIFAAIIICIVCMIAINHFVSKNSDRVEYEQL